MEELKIEVMQKLQEMREKEQRSEPLSDNDHKTLFIAALLEENGHGERN